MSSFRYFLKNFLIYQARFSISSPAIPHRQSVRSFITKTTFFSCALFQRYGNRKLTINIKKYLNRARGCKEVIMSLQLTVDNSDIKAEAKLSGLTQSFAQGAGELFKKPALPLAFTAALFAANPTQAETVDGLDGKAYPSFDTPEDVAEYSCKTDKPVFWISKALTKSPTIMENFQGREVVLGRDGLEISLAFRGGFKEGTYDFGQGSYAVEAGDNLAGLYGNFQTGDPKYASFAGKLEHNMGGGYSLDDACDTGKYAHKESMGSEYLILSSQSLPCVST